MPRDLRLPAGLGRAYRFGAEPAADEMRVLFRRAFVAAVADAETTGNDIAMPLEIRMADGRDVEVVEALGPNFFGGRRFGRKGPPPARAGPHRPGAAAASSAEGAAPQFARREPAAAVGGP